MADGKGGTIAAGPDGGGAGSYQASRSPDLPAPAGYGAPVHAPPQHAAQGQNPREAAPVSAVYVEDGGAGAGAGRRRRHLVVQDNVDAVCCCIIPFERFRPYAVVVSVLAVAMSVAAGFSVEAVRNRLYCPHVDASWPDTEAGSRMCVDACGDDCGSLSGLVTFAFYMIMAAGALAVAAMVWSWSVMTQARDALGLPEANEARVSMAARVRTVYHTCGTLLAAVLVVLAAVWLSLGETSGQTNDAAATRPMVWTGSLASVLAVFTFFQTHISKVRYRLLAGLRDRGRPDSTELFC